MKKIYNSVELQVVVVSASDIITNSIEAEVRSTSGVTGGQALAPDRGFDCNYEEY